jgi:hypothetical protein
MQNAAPEHPDAFPLDVKKRHYFQPPFLIAIRHPRQPGRTQLLVASPKAFRRELLRQQRGGLGFAAQTNEFGKESPLGKELVLHNFQDRGRFVRRFESHVSPGELPPQSHHFVGFAGLSIEQMLKNRICCARYLRFRNCRIVILHGHDCRLRFDNKCLPNKSYAPGCLREHLPKGPRFASESLDANTGSESVRN